MERIQFNTGRGYSENGQRIVAVKHEGRIYFQDHDRHIDGSFDAADDELFGPVELNQVVVMSRYDHGNYEYHPMTIDVQQALIWQVRCHKCHQVVTRVTPVDRARSAGKISDMAVLRTLAICCRDSDNEYRDAANQRRAMHRRIAECAEGGMIAMVWSGMDCDCVRYQGDVRLVAADWREIDKAADKVYIWADGPCGFYLERPSVAENIQRSSRDLALEAFEDGHPHSIHY